MKKVRVKESWTENLCLSWRGATRAERAAFVYFLLITFVSLLVTFLKPVHPHFWIWVGAAQRLADGNQLTPIVTGVTDFFRAWLYPPSTSLFFYPFIKLPMPLGQAIYIIGSTVVLGVGFLSMLSVSVSGRDRGIAGLAFFYLIFASDMVSAIPVIRLELLSLGVCFYSGFLLVSGRRGFAAGFWLGAVTSLKLQLFPSLCLCALVACRFSRPFLVRYLGGAAIGLALLPAIFSLVFDPDYVGEAYRIWAQNLSRGSEVTWTGYQSLFSTTHAWFARPLGIRTLSLLSTIAALGFAAVVIAKAWLQCADVSDRRTRAELVLLALGLGGMFTVLFSPMSQGAGYLLGAPLVLLATLYRREARSTRQRRLWTAALMSYWIMSYLVYSDVVPKSVQRYSLEIHLRPVGAAVLTFAILTAFRVYLEPFVTKTRGLS